MGTGQVVTTVLEWATAALKEHPFLVAPTLLILASVVVFAAIEAATITVQVATIMIRHLRHRLSELLEALRDLRSELPFRRKPRLHLTDLPPSDTTRSNSVQRDLLSQQQLFNGGRRQPDRR